MLQGFMIHLRPLFLPGRAHPTQTVQGHRLGPEGDRPERSRHQRPAVSVRVPPPSRRNPTP